MFGDLMAEVCEMMREAIIWTLGLSELNYKLFVHFLKTEPCFQMVLSLECKYKKLQFAISICSIEVSKLTLCIATSLCLQQNLQQKKSIQEHLLSLGQWVSEEFQVSSIGACAAFLCRMTSS